MIDVSRGSMQGTTLVYENCLERPLVQLLNTISPGASTVISRIILSPLQLATTATATNQPNFILSCRARLAMAVTLKVSPRLDKDMDSIAKAL